MEFEFVYWDNPRIVARFNVVAHWKKPNRSALRITITRNGEVYDVWDWEISTLTRHRRQYVREMLSGALAWAHEGNEQASPRGHVPPIPWATLMTRN